VYKAAREGDELARAATIAAARAVGQGLASVVNVLNPDTVVLAGHLSGLLEDYQHTLLEELRFTLARESLEVQVVPPVFGTDSIVIGAAELALEPVLTQPSQLIAANWAVRSE
jgi:predicted NBD/HSP70 family sugar kinase